MSKKDKDKFVPYEKSSKKEKKYRDKEKRNDWGVINPITKVIPNKKRDHSKRKRDDYYEYDWYED